MKSIVVYATRHGNTEKIAAAIAEGLRNWGSVAIFEAAKAPVQLADDINLIVVGGPTEAHALTEPVAGYLDRIEKGGLNGKRAAAFDTRLRFPRWVSGSAASNISKRLRSKGADLIDEPASFFVAGKVPQLEPGEIERATAWASALGEPNLPSGEEEAVRRKVSEEAALDSWTDAVSVAGVPHAH